MTAEDKTNGESANGGVDPRSLSIQGSVDESTVVVGDRNVINQGPIYYIINVLGFLKARQSPARLQHLRIQLLQQMKTNVAKRLEDSLHNLTRVDLEAEDQRYQVGRRRKLPLVEMTPNSTKVSHRPMKRELAISKNSEKRESIPAAEQTSKIFHRSDIGERLLILGEPGSGKTTELLTVTQRLVDAAIEDDTQPIPLIFELSSWSLNTPIERWLGQQLHKSYGVSKTLAEPLAKQWVKQSRIMPLLDGLDELGQRNQIACIKSLENFLAQHPTLPVIVCCRREEYEQGGEQLTQLNGAIYLQAVELKQIQQYFKDLRREYLWESIQTEPELLELAQSPLFLTMLVIAYHGQPIRDRSSLFNAYIQTQLHDLSHQGTYKPGKEKSPEQTLSYLRWLAKQLEHKQETEFSIEDLQPEWLSSDRQRQAYKRAFILNTMLMSGFGLGLSLGLIGGLFGGLVGGLIEGFFTGLIGGLFGGLVGGLFGLIGGLLFKLVEGLNVIKPIEKLRWNPRQGLFGGLFTGLFIGLLGGFIDPRIGPSVRFVFGLFFGLSSGLSTTVIRKKKIPNQGIRKSFQNSLIIGLVVWLAGGLFLGLVGGLFGGLGLGLFLGLLSGLGLGLVGGLVGGLGATIQHFSLRIVLTKNSDTPWNYAQFLEHAVRHRFIQRTGGRYRFVHNLLRQHFAQITPEQRTLLAQSTSNRP